jgi:hypothetical protein
LDISRLDDIPGKRIMDLTFPLHELTGRYQRPDLNRQFFEFPPSTCICLKNLHVQTKRL